MKDCWARLDVVVATYQQYKELPILLHSFLVQRNPNWCMLVIHDGKDPVTERIVRDLEDDRIRYMESDKRFNDYGHSLRRLAIPFLDSEYVLFTNGDNYYVPPFTQYMLEVSEGADIVYCDMLHNYKQFDYRGYVDTRLQCGYIDCGAVMVKTELAKQVGWRDLTQAGDWTFLSDVLTLNAEIKSAKVPKVLFVHN